MRVFATALSALIVTVMAAQTQTQAMDWDTLRVNVPPDAEATVSFSIGYPNGWMVFQDYGQERQDIYNDIPVPCGPRYGSICSFNQPATPNTLKEGSTFYSVWMSHGATAKDAAEEFFTDKRTASVYTQKSLTPIKTSAGDSGWLVESEGYLIADPAIGKLMLDPAFMRKTNSVQILTELDKHVKPSEKVPVIYHDFFFHSGYLGAIRVETMTQAKNLSWRSRLDRVVLETLRFNGI